MVEITCPDWCELSGEEEHAARLWDKEGHCVHQKEVAVADPSSTMW